VEQHTTTSGPLAGLRVLEFAAIGPAPFAAMMLADLGAEVLRIERPGPEVVADRVVGEGQLNILGRGRRRVVMNLKAAGASDVVDQLIASADVLMEGFRPGVAERLGFGPDHSMSINRRLVYARITGWGREGPMAQTAGHDINYIAITGVLHAIGRAGGPPQVPINLLGDFAAGGMVSAFGICAALLERERSDRGQVVDTAIVDGVATLLAMPLERFARGQWLDERGTNSLDTGAASYDVYETADHKWVAVGAREPQFYDELLERLQLTDLPDRADPQADKIVHERLSDAFRQRSRDQWAAAFAGSDACVTPVLSLAEAIEDPHLRERQTFITSDLGTEPAPAPRFSRTPGAVRRVRAENPAEILEDWGVAESASVVAAGLVGAP
jgi:alpha-methylacyl-CoA racemase